MSIPPTNPLYYASSTQLECQSTVLSVEEASGYKEPNCYVVILDQSVCYPQGGGQPSDTGIIVKDDENTFRILEARTNRDTKCIQHFGKFLGQQFEVGDSVSVKIDGDKRLLYSRIHSAGHLIDACLSVAGYKFKANKANHFPDSPFVDYIGEIEDSEIEPLRIKLEEMAKKLIADDVPVHIHLDVNLEDAKVMCGGEIDEIYLKSPTLRLVSIGEYFTGPCGGTHVRSTKELKCVRIPKISVKKSKKTMNVRYTVID